MLVFYGHQVYNDHMITCVLLSAGLSQRFGSPKALAKLHNETVIEHLQKMLVETQVGEIIVVLGAHADQIKPYLLDHKKVTFVYNKDYNFGQTSSFKTGVKNVSNDTRGIMLLPVDFPFVSSDTITTLIQYFLDNRPNILIPMFKDKKGHPPLFSSKFRDEFLALDNESGLNTVAHTHQSEITSFPVEDIGVISTFNTLDEFESIKGLK